MAAIIATAFQQAWVGFVGGLGAEVVAVQRGRGKTMLLDVERFGGNW